MSGAWWTPPTVNPIVGCSPPTPDFPDCTKCWGRRFAMRQIKREGPTGDAYRDVIKDGEWTGTTRFIESALRPVPGRGKVVFVSSMGDLWHETAHTEWIDKVLAWAERHPQHTFVNCTKRPRRAAGWPGKFPDNWVQLVSVGNQKTADERIPDLLRCKAKIIGLHMEPLIGPVDLERIEWPGKGGHRVDVLRAGYHDERFGFVNHSDMPGAPNPISWIVCGAETGPGARPCKTEWVRSIVRQGAEAGVPVWVKKAPGCLDAGEVTRPWPREKPEGMPR